MNTERLFYLQLFPIFNIHKFNNFSFNTFIILISFINKKQLNRIATMLLSKKNPGKTDKHIHEQHEGPTKNSKINKQTELLKSKKNTLPLNNKELQQKKYSIREQSIRSKSPLIGQKCFSEKDDKKKVCTPKNQDDSQTELKGQGISQKNKLIEIQLEQQQRIRERIVQSTSIQGNGDNQQLNKIKISSQLRKMVPDSLHKANQIVKVSNYQPRLRESQLVQYQQICNEIQLKNLQSKAIPPIGSQKSRQNHHFFHKIQESQSGVTKQLNQQGKISQTHFIPLKQEQAHNYQYPIQQQKIIKRKQQSFLHMNSDEEEKINRSVMRAIGKIQNNSGRKSIKVNNQIRINTREAKQRSDSIEQRQYHPIINQSNLIITTKIQSVPTASGKINRRRKTNMAMVPEIVNISLNQINQESSKKKEDPQLNEQVQKLRKTVRELRLEKIKAQAQLMNPLELIPSSISKTISYGQPSKHRYQTLDSLLTCSNELKNRISEHKVDKQKPLFGKIRKNRSLSRKKSDYCSQIFEQLHPNNNLNFSINPHNYLSANQCEIKLNNSNKQSQLLKQYKTICLEKIAEQHLQESILPQERINMVNRPLPQNRNMKASFRGQEIGQTVLNKFQKSDQKFKNFLQKEASRSKMNRNVSKFEEQINSADNPQISKQLTEDCNDQPIFKTEKDKKTILISKNENEQFDGYEYISDKNMSLIIQGEKLKIQKKVINPSHINIPNIPEAPNQNTTTENLMNLIIQILPFSGQKYKEQDMNECILKRYKNCITFQLSSNIDFKIVWHFTNKLYLGEWDSIYNQKNGKGIEIIKDKSFFKGEFVNGKKNGQGLMVHSNGNIYEGEWSNSQRQGYGKYNDKIKCCYYEGHWKNGKKQGLSHYEYNQNIYEGQFNNNVKCGFGVQLFKNGDKYIGEYSNGKFHGEGKYIWENGAYYIGYFSGGYKHGRGRWQSGGQNSEIYLGQFQKDKKQGKGKYAWSNRCIYEGSFHNDLKHGMGNIQYPDGRYMQGIWTLGILTQVISKVTQAHRQEPLQQPKSRSIQTRTLIKVFDKPVELEE